MKYSLGLDIGSESVGWAVVELDESDHPVRIIRMGVRCFEAVQQEQASATTPAQERRLARSQRRRLRSRKRRKRRLVELCIEKGLVKDKEEANTFLVTLPGDETPWGLRVKGLNERLDKRSWFRVLYHLVNHRGYKSTKILDSNNKSQEDTKKMLGSAHELHKLWKEKGYRTVAEFLENDIEWKEKHGERRRNKEGSFEFTILRDDLIYEAGLLFEKQRSYGNPYADEDFEKRYLEILDEPPRLLQGDQLREKVGKCTFEDEEYRAPKATISAQLFVALQELVNTKVVDLETGEEIKFSPEEIRKIVEEGKKKKELKVKEILKFVGKDSGKYAIYNSRKLKENEENEAFLSFSYYHKIKSLLEKTYPEDWEKLANDDDLFDSVAEVLTYYFYPEDIIEKLTDRGLSKEAANELTQVSFKGNVKLSLKAIRKILPYLFDGNTYYKACEKAGYDHRAIPEKKILNWIPPFESDDASPQIKKEYQNITNPNVRRALNQTRKVVNAIVREYGAPYRINIELAREMTLPPKKRQQILEENKAREKMRKDAVRKLIESGVDNPNRKLIEKYLLYEIQAGKCAYSLKDIDFKRMILDDTYTEIDHIIPRSISFDNSMKNKVLVLADENRNKGNELAAAYVRNHYGEEHFQRYLAFVKNVIIKNMGNKKSVWGKQKSDKEKYLLMEDVSEEQKNEMRDRYLKATQYASRFFAKVIKTYFDIPEGRIITLSGRITSDLRYLSGLSEAKLNRFSDKHHAIDALMCAICDKKIVHRLSNYFKKQGDPYKTAEERGLSVESSSLDEQMVLPWKNFRHDALKMVDQIVVSRAPKKRVTGKGHSDTIYSLKHVKRAGIEVPEKGKIAIPKVNGSDVIARPTQRVRLDQLSEAQIKEILKEPSPILVDEKSNSKLYALIRERLLQVEERGKDWAKKAFPPENPIRMPTKTGDPGPAVRKIKIFTDVLSGVAVRGGIAENRTIVRLDIYRRKSKNGKYQYYVAPVYAADIAAGRSPDRVVASGKTENEWPLIDDSFEFMFYLFPGECIRVFKNEKTEPVVIYRTSFDRNSGKIVGNFLDRSNRNESGGINPVRVAIQNCMKLEKIYVDLLGNIHTVRKEKKIY